MAQAEEKAQAVYSALPRRPEKLEEMIATAQKIATRGRGILAADESTGTIGKRFHSIWKDIPKKTERDAIAALVSNEGDEGLENRRRYREMLFTSPDIEKSISGVIMFEETLYQKTKDGIPFVEVLNAKGIVPGIKVDKGTIELPFKPNEKFTQGLTGLDSKPGAKGRAQTYYEAGARFAKWRAVCTIQNGVVSQTAIQETAWTLARYAATCQKNGLVPIVEPELLMDGNHSLEVCQYWTEKIVTACYKALSDQEVVLEATLLKPNMCLPGADWVGQRNIEANAKATVEMLQRSVPAAVPGIVFLSGGQSEEEATLHLNAMNKIGNGPDNGRAILPWSVTFSFGRALQASCLKSWQGKNENIEAGQKTFIARAKANSDAQLGEYDPKNATEESKASLYEKNYVY